MLCSPSPFFLEFLNPVISTPLPLKKKKINNKEDSFICSALQRSQKTWCFLSPLCILQMHLLNMEECSFLYSQLKRIKTRIWGLEPGLLLGEKPHSVDADLILSLSSLRYSPAPPALTRALIALLHHLRVCVGGGSHNPSGWLDISPPPLFFSRENLLISAKLKSQT